MRYKHLKFNDNTVFLVTGGAGFIGSNLCEAILEMGYKVRCLDNISTGKRENVDQQIRAAGFDVKLSAKSLVKFYLQCHMKKATLIDSYIQTLDESIMQREIDKLAKVDWELYLTMGRLFSEEIWREHNFIKNIPGKWDLSVLATIGNQVCGYIIASTANEENIHINRFVTAPKYHGTGIARQMHNKLLANSFGHAYKYINLFVNSQNMNARHVYEHFGYQTLTGEELTNYLFLKGITASGGCCFKNMSGDEMLVYRYCLWNEV